MTIVALSIGFWGGYEFCSMENDARLADARMEQMAAADLASRKEAERLAAEAARSELATQLEDAANAQASTSSCLPLSRVLRLNRR